MNGVEAIGVAGLVGLDKFPALDAKEVEHGHLAAELHLVAVLQGNATGSLLQGGAVGLAVIDRSDIEASEQTAEVDLQVVDVVEGVDVGRADVQLRGKRLDETGQEGNE